MFLAEFRGPGVRHPYDESGDDYDLDLDQRTRGMGSRSGKIILLGDGTEVLTDCDDTEMFDHSEEDKDLDSQVNKSQATASEDQKGSRSEREGTPAPQSERRQTPEPVEASSVSNPTKVEKTRSPQSYLNQSLDAGLPTKLANPPKDK